MQVLSFGGEADSALHRRVLPIRLSGHEMVQMY